MGLKETLEKTARQAASEASLKVIKDSLKSQKTGLKSLESIFDNTQRLDVALITQGNEKLYVLPISYDSDSKFGESVYGAFFDKIRSARPSSVLVNWNGYVAIKVEKAYSTNNFRIQTNHGLEFVINVTKVELDDTNRSRAKSNVSRTRTDLELSEDPYIPNVKKGFNFDITLAPCNQERGILTMRGVRHYFPGYKVPFTLEFYEGDQKRKITVKASSASRSKNPKQGDLVGNYLTGLYPFHRAHPGITQVTLEVIKPGEIYRVVNCK